MVRHKRWFDLRLRSQLGLYFNFPKKHAAILGREGLQEFERSVLTAKDAHLVSRRERRIDTSELDSMLRDIARLKASWNQ